MTDKWERRKKQPKHVMRIKWRGSGLRVPSQRPDSGPVYIHKPDGTLIVQPARRAKISDTLADVIWYRDRKCRYCRNHTGPFHIDHVVPVKKGGKTTVANLVLSCAKCNLRKGVQVWQPIPLEYMGIVRT